MGSKSLFFGCSSSICKSCPKIMSNWNWNPGDHPNADQRTDNQISGSRTNNQIFGAELMMERCANVSSYGVLVFWRFYFSKMGLFYPIFFLNNNTSSFCTFKCLNGLIWKNWSYHRILRFRSGFYFFFHWNLWSVLRKKSDDWRLCTSTTLLTPTNSILY